jgi:hypothetical protein
VSKARKTLRTYGERGRSARVFVERGGTRVRVQWRVHGLLQTKSFPNTAAGKGQAKSFAQGVVDSLEARAIPARVTVAELWGLYAKSELPNLRPRTFALNADAWREWELFVGRETVAEDLGVDTMTRFRVALENERKLGGTSCIDTATRWARTGGRRRCPSTGPRSSRRSWRSSPSRG